MVDKHGNTVEVATINNRQCYIPRSPRGFVLGQSMGVDKPLPTEPRHLAQLGIDLASLKPLEG